MKMTFSFVIPTKNRPTELATVFEAILSQNRLPDQVIIIDQSSPDKVIKEQLAPLAKKANLTLNYVHDENIKGLVQAKAASIQYNQCDYISFFDDDIVHEPNYLAGIEEAINIYPDMIGVNGVILNAPKEGLLRRLIFRLTHFGLYKDNRQSVIRSLTPNTVLPQAVDALSGGLSTWRKEVFETVSFDTKNKFHAYEDKEFSIRIERVFPKQMFIVPSAKLYHYHAAGNRQSLLRRTENDVVEVWMLFKKNGNFSYLGLDFVVLLFGLFFNALLLSLKLFNLRFLWNYFKGFNRGRKKQIIKT
jgi:GT2 family glycosyltransferase